MHKFLTLADKIGKGACDIMSDYHLDPKNIFCVENERVIDLITYAGSSIGVHI